MNALVPQTNVEAYKASTDAAALCREMVVQTATTIQGRKYVQVEGWQSIAIAHGCTGSARDVERVEGGVRAIGEIRRMSDGQVIATAEGFVGEDEPTWYGGETVTRYGKKVLPKRPDYAIRAMAQTRAISRACRSAFAHVVVMMNAGLQTTPAEEVPLDGFDNTPAQDTAAPANDGLKRGPDGRLISAEAKRQKIHEPLIARIDAADLTGLIELERDFASITQDHPAKWLEGYRDRMEARRKELMTTDAEFAPVDWEEREKPTDDVVLDALDDFPGDRRATAAA